MEEAVHEVGDGELEGKGRHNQGVLGLLGHGEQDVWLHVHLAHHPHEHLLHTACLHNHLHFHQDDFEC